MQKKSPMNWGAGHPIAARLALGKVLILPISDEDILVGLIMCLIRNAWGYASSSEIQVVSYVATSMPIQCILPVISFDFNYNVSVDILCKSI